MNYQAQPPSAIGTSLGMTASPCPQGFPWQLPAMNCQAQPPWTTGTSPGVTALPGPGVPANGAGSFLATFQSQAPHPAPAVPFMPPLPASPPPSKPPLPSVPPPPKSPPPPVSPPPNPPTHERPPLPSSAPRSTPPRSQESPCSSPLQSPQRKENRSRCRSSKYPIWAPSDTKYYREEYHGHKRSGTTSSRSSRSTR
ncbi:hypothetical protein HPB50_008336 [Hyalomma asiaticum]|uniref:Uncharacterized protein n=1 Tax=Hyalomma asiaticum TaxID=266040 RepID=A0ACB7RR51_HYAAI|nr:hypothetical protein HPB50_008336 [Hyalomma asiaticum]